MEEDLAGRRYGRVYRVAAKRRALQREFLEHAVEASGGVLLHASAADRAPVFLGIALPDDSRVGVLCYAFGCTTGSNNRPADERRLQIRFGGEKSWESDHSLGRDVAGVDTTVVLGIDVEEGVFIGLDAALYDPLPMGISIEYKDSFAQAARRDGFSVWERVARIGRRRPPRTAQGIEAVVAFAPERFLDYVSLEREATALGLDTGLRHRLAMKVAAEPGRLTGRDTLIEEFDLTSEELVEIIRTNRYLGVAVRGGVAEHHLVRALNAEDGVTAERTDRAGEADARAFVGPDREGLVIECKNAAPLPYADGAFKVEVQRTRASKGDPASRYYTTDDFDVLAVCLFSPTGKWDFKYRSSRDLEPHPDFPGRIRPMQRIDSTWFSSLTDVAQPT